MTHPMSALPHHRCPRLGAKPDSTRIERSFQSDLNRRATAPQDAHPIRHSRAPHPPDAARGYRPGPLFPGGSGQPEERLMSDKYWRALETFTKLASLALLLLIGALIVVGI